MEPSVKIYHIDNILIEQVAETKFLGVIITDNLTWDNHIKTVCNDVSKGIGMICKIRHFIPPGILINLYFTLVHPYFEYCNIVWATNLILSLSKLSNMLKRTMRVITNFKWNAHTTPIFKNLCVLTLYNINKFHTGYFMFKVNNTLLQSTSIGRFLKKYEYS